MSAAVRGWLGEQIHTRVVGPDAVTRRAELFETSEPGWFAEGAPIRRVHGDASMFVGGLRALLFQSLHPRAMAGVAQHSDYRGRPVGTAAADGRLPRRDHVRADLRGRAGSPDVVRRVHRRVVGGTVTGRGGPTRRATRICCGWVHIAELDSFLAAHDRFGRATARRRANAIEYVAESAVVARALGVELAPPDKRGGATRPAPSARTDPSSGATREARDAARYLLVQPPLPLAGRAAYGLIAAAAVSLMPVWTRWPLRLPWLPISEATLGRAVGDVVTKSLRWAIVPHPNS